MNKLFELQSAFMATLMDEPRDLGIKSGGRLKVYTNAYHVRLKESLEEDFPETLSYFDNSDHVVDQYIQSHPSGSWTLAEFGAMFPEYIKVNFPDASEAQLEAKLEWAEWVAFHLGEPEISMNLVPKDDFSLVFNPTLQVVEHEQRVIIVYYFNGQTHRLEIFRPYLYLIEGSLKNIPFSIIKDELPFSYEDIVQILGTWSKEGLINGIA